MTAPVLQPTPPDEYAQQFGLALAIADRARPRSTQTDGGQLGASDALTCAQKAVYTVTQTPPTNSPKKGQAQRGTYLHEGTLRDVGAAFPHKIIEAELTVTLPSGIELLLHPDEIDPEEPSVTDYKFVDDLALVRRTGSSDQQKAQTALQYLAAHQAGLVPAEGIVRNLFVACDDLDLRHVEQEPFSMEWVHRADEWFQSVIYAVQHGEEAAKEWPIPMCRSYCPWFALCRGDQIRPEAKIEDATIIRAAHEYYQAKQEIKELEAVAKAAATHLTHDVAGEADGLRVRSVWNNPSEPKMSKGRAGFWRLEVQPV